MEILFIIRENKARTVSQFVCDLITLRNSRIFILSCSTFTWADEYWFPFMALIWLKLIFILVADGISNWFGMERLYIDRFPNKYGCNRIHKRLHCGPQCGILWILWDWLSGWMFMSCLSPTGYFAYIWNKQPWAVVLMFCSFKRISEWAGLDWGFLGGWLTVEKRKLCLINTRNLGGLQSKGLCSYTIPIFAPVEVHLLELV